MIKSMTGYGKAEATAGTKKITAEVRSLNSKQLDLSVRMPAAYRQAEYEIRTTAAKAMQRGKVELYINVENSVVSGGVTINSDLFCEYYRQLEEIGRRNNMDWGSDVVSAMTIPSILRLPEVVQNESNVVSDEEQTALMSAVAGALAEADKFRVQEGAILIADLLARIDKIGELRRAVEPFEAGRAEVVRTRIREGIESLGLQVDENRLEQEMIFYIEKLDITEEKTRLDNHLNYFREVAGEEEGVGRKLGFIGQEIGREINTMGSKANDASIQRLVVQMKDELEKIKEQVLNIL